MAYPGFQRGGCLRSGPIRKVGGGGGGQSTSGPIYMYEKWEGGGTVHFRSDIRKVCVCVCVWGGAVHVRSDIRKVCVCGGGQSTSGPIYKKCGRGVGGGAVRFRSDTFVWHTEKTLSLIINSYNFDQGGVLKHFTRARE